MTNIVVKNERIIKFYNDNPSLSFEGLNLIFIDLLEKLLDEKNSSMNSAINSQILSVVENLTSKISTIDKSVNNLNTDIVNSIYIKLQESKREYFENIRDVVSNNFSSNNEKISNLLQLHTSQHIDKTNLLLNDIVPKNNTTLQSQINNSMTIFQKSISAETTKIMNAVNKEESISSFINNFETKSTNMLQPLFSYINASEERISKNISSLTDDFDNSARDKIMDDLSEFLGKYKNSSYKGQFGENQLETVLNQLYPTGEINNTTGVKASCDFRVNRTNLPTILFETKNYDRNVTMDEVKKFIRDIDEQGSHGIFLSQHSGITSKQNFQIDIKGKNILVYVHNVDYSPNIIKIASDIIDSLADKLVEITEDKEEFNISKEIIDDINKEYAKVLERKKNIIDITKDFTKKMISEVDEIKFPVLSTYLTSKCGSILNDENVIICNICNEYKANSNKALAAHQRGCKRKMNSNIVIDT